MISVIMLTYNRENLIVRAIESILSQTFRDFEFIIVDNGSSDRSGQIADEYAAKDHRVRVIHRERGNIGAGRNTGLDAVQGEYITFVDDDDYAEPCLLEHLHDLVVSNSAEIAVCGSWREVEGVRQPKYVFDGVFTYKGEDAVVELLKREKFNSANPTKLIASQILGQIRYDESGKYDDIKTVYRQFACAQTVAVSGVPLYTFVRHERNNSTGTTVGETIPAGQIEEYLAAFRERTCWLTEQFPDKADYWLYTELSYALSMYDKTEDAQIRGTLRSLLVLHAEAFLAVKELYTRRDRMLVEQYGGRLFAGYV